MSDNEIEYENEQSEYDEWKAIDDAQRAREARAINRGEF